MFLKYNQTPPKTAFFIRLLSLYLFTMIVMILKDFIYIIDIKFNGL